MGLLCNNWSAYRAYTVASVLSLGAVALSGCGGAFESGAECDGADFAGLNVTLPGVGRDVVSQVGAFSRSRSRDDVSPRELRFLRPGGHVFPGDPRVVLSESRLLLSGGGDRGFRLYAVPTEDGAVCWQLTETFEGGCSEEDVLRVAVTDQGGPGRCLPVHVAGVIPDRVSAVDVVVAGRRHRAQLGENSFFFEADDPQPGRDDVTMLIFHFRDGSPIYRENLS